MWGLVSSGEVCLAACFVHWTRGQVPDAGANVDLIIGAWGEGTRAEQRQAIAMEYRISDTGPWFSVIDAERRPVSESDLVGRALGRDEVIGAPVAKTAFAIVDALWVQDTRLAELQPVE